MKRSLILLRMFASALLLTSNSGCSFLFVTPPPAQPKQYGTFKCTTSKVAPALDTVFTGLEVVRTGLAVAADDSVYQDPKQPLSRGADIALGLGFTALFLSSAIYGYVSTSNCAAAKQGYEEHEQPERSEPPATASRTVPADDTPANELPDGSANVSKAPARDYP